MSSPAPSTGLRLLQRLLEAAPGGRIFTSEDAVAVGQEMDLTSGHVYKLLSELTEQGLLERPRWGLYVMQPPLGGMAPPRPLAIAVRAVSPAAVSGDTALVHWELLEQAPMHEEVVSSPARIQWTHGVRADGTDRLWTVGGTTIRFRRVPADAMIGITTVRLDSETVVPMFDRERAIVELLTKPKPGSVKWAGELMREHQREIDRLRLRRYARRLGAGSELMRAQRAVAPNVHSKLAT